MIIKKLAAFVITAGLFLFGAVSIAGAGEITGNGKDLKPLNANSECAFSGLDDADDDGFGRTQSWGQIPKAERGFLTSIGVHPSTLCNGNRNPQR